LGEIFLLSNLWKIYLAEEAQSDSRPEVRRDEITPTHSQKPMELRKKAYHRLINQGIDERLHYIGLESYGFASLLWAHQSSQT
jgi:hypothetical protein